MGNNDSYTPVIKKGTPPPPSGSNRLRSDTKAFLQTCQSVPGVWCSMETQTRSHYTSVVAALTRHGLEVQRRGMVVYARYHAPEPTPP